jgi:hypothetical protein
LENWRLETGPEIYTEEREAFNVSPQLTNDDVETSEDQADTLGSIDRLRVKLLNMEEELATLRKQHEEELNEERARMREEYATRTPAPMSTSHLHLPGSTSDHMTVVVQQAAPVTIAPRTPAPMTTRNTGHRQLPHRP